MIRIVVQGVEDVWSNIHSQFQNKMKKFEWFSLVLGELTDVTVTAQLFSWGVSAEFEVTGEIVSEKSVWNIYMQECFLKIWENANSVKPEEKSAKMCYSWWWQ